jgi:hypothetical protein
VTRFLRSLTTPAVVTTVFDWKITVSGWQLSYLTIPRHKIIDHIYINIIVYYIKFLINELQLLWGTAHNSYWYLVPTYLLYWKWAGYNIVNLLWAATCIQSWKARETLDTSDKRYDISQELVLCNEHLLSLLPSFEKRKTNRLVVRDTAAYRVIRTDK